MTSTESTVSKDDVHSSQCMWDIFTSTKPLFKGSFEVVVEQASSRGWGGTPILILSCRKSLLEWTKWRPLPEVPSRWQPFGHRGPGGVLRPLPTRNSSRMNNPISRPCRLPKQLPCCNGKTLEKLRHNHSSAAIERRVCWPIIPWHKRSLTNFKDNRTDKRHCRQEVSWMKKKKMNLLLHSHRLQLDETRQPPK